LRHSRNLLNSRHSHSGALQMKVKSRILWVPKQGRTADETEDAFWPPEPVNLETKLCRFAVADGATDTFFASEWAKVLANAYGRGELSDRKISLALPHLREEWRESTGMGDFPVYGGHEQSLDAFSTILGLTLYRSPLYGEHAWRALAIGDSCLFQVRNDQIIESFPMSHSDEFVNRPMLMSTNADAWEDELNHSFRAAGTWQPNDTFYLMTDAIATWFLYAYENGLRPSGVLDFPAEDSGAFDRWVALSRELGLRNDDVTILTVVASY
jgi:hypothetical protein